MQWCHLSCRTKTSGAAQDRVFGLLSSLSARMRMLRAFVRWWCACTSSVRGDVILRAVGMVKLRNLYQLVLPRALSAWSRLACEARRNRGCAALFKSLSSSNRKFVVGSVLRAWRNVTATGRKRRTMTQFAASILRQRMLARASFATWSARRDIIVAHVQAKALADRVSASVVGLLRSRSLLGLMLRSFLTWRLRWSVASGIARTLALTSTPYGHRTLQNSVARWRMASLLGSASRRAISLRSEAARGVEVRRHVMVKWQAFLAWSRRVGLVEVVRVPAVVSKSVQTSAADSLEPPRAEKRPVMASNGHRMAPRARKIATARARRWHGRRLALAALRSWGRAAQLRDDRSEREVHTPVAPVAPMPTVAPQAAAGKLALTPPSGGGPMSAAATETGLRLVTPPPLQPAFQRRRTDPVAALPSQQRAAQATLLQRSNRPRAGLEHWEQVSDRARVQAQHVYTMSGHLSQPSERALQAEAAVAIASAEAQSSLASLQAFAYQ
jgi:hypothetical protein